MNYPFILIVEDNKRLARLFSIALQAAKFDTEIVADGEEALTRLDSVEPDLVILDLHLPRLSGEAILHKINTEERLTHTRVIVATADNQLAQQLEAEAELAILKPISINRLTEQAHALLDQPPNPRISNL